MVSWQEQRIVRAAAQSDFVYMLGIPSWQLHEQLARLPNTRVIMDVVDGLWLPYHRQFGWERLEEMLPIADGVVCENEHIGEHVRQ